METLGSRIRAAREAKGLTQGEVARFFKISRVSVTQWEGDTTKPQAEKIDAHAELLAVSPHWLREASGAPPAQRQLPRVSPIPGRDMVGAADFPVYAAAQGGDGHMIVTFDLVDSVKRPWNLEGARNAYALLISGDSMKPAFNHGDMALVHPGLQPARDKVHIFYDHPPFGASGEVEAIIKNLNGWTDKIWQLEQYNPAKQFSVDRVDWPTAHRVVGRYDGR